MLRLALTFAALLALFLIGNVDAKLPPNVRGTVQTPSSIDKTSTVCSTDEPCDPPIGAFSTYVSFSRVSHPTVRVRAVDGAFALHLAPATYRIAVSPALGTVSPATVRVPRAGVVRLHVVVQPTP